VDAGDQVVGTAQRRALGTGGVVPRRARAGGALRNLWIIARGKMTVDSGTSLRHASAADLR
jgi:hypothetical protein